MMAYNPWLDMSMADAARQKQQQSQAPAPLPFSGPNPDFIGYLQETGYPGAAPGNDLAAAQTSIEQQASEPPIVGGDVPRGAQVGETVQTKVSGPAGQSIQELIAGLNKRELASLEQQGLSIEKLRSALGQLEGSELPTDLTPLASLVDTWTGSNFAAAYKPQETLKDRRAAVDKLQGQILQAEQGLSENELAMLRSGLNSQFQVENLHATERQRQEQNALERQKLELDRAKLQKVNPIDPLAGFKMRTDIEKLDTTKKVMGSIDLAQALNEYEAAVNKYGTSPTGEGAAALNGAYSRITLAYKNAGELGALSGPDMGIVEQGVRNAGSFDAWLKGAAKGGQSGVRTQIQAMRNATKGGFDSRMNNLKAITKGYEPLVGDLVNNYDQQMRGAMGQAPVDEQAAARAWAQANPKDPRAAKILENLGGK